MNARSSVIDWLSALEACNLSLSALCVVQMGTFVNRD